MEGPVQKKLFGETQKQHPKEKAGLVSTIFFCWTLPMFVKGFRKDLTEDDLYGPLEGHVSKSLSDKLTRAWDIERRRRATPSLAKALIKVYIKEFLYLSFFTTVQELVVKMTQPLLVGKVLEYYAPNQTHTSITQAYMYAVGLILLLFIDNLIQHSCFLGLQHLALKMQVACRALIYNKSLKLSKTAMEKRTVGQIVNLISNDVSRFNYICLHLHQVIIAPIQTMLVMYLLFATLNSAAMTGVGLLLICIPLQMYMGKLTAYYRLRTALKTDNRLRLMNEIVSGIQVIKMYTWEKPFSKLVEIARKLEIHEITANSYVRSVFVSMSMFLVRTSIFLCVLTYILTGNVLQAQFVYVVTSFYGNLRQPLTLHLPRCIAMLAEINVSLKRIEDFLLCEEVQEVFDDPHDVNVGLVLDEVSVKWSPSATDYNLNDISFKANAHEVVAVVGPVGSGKSTLLQVVLREISILKGHVTVTGGISYSSQEPWLFSASIRQNILFGQSMNFEKYTRVLNVCALERDVSLLPYGDQTLVGERGVMLSGGQKARVSLARAIYRDADIYLLDDPLSAVDAHVGKRLFDDCILGYLRNKCVVLVTHQVQHLSKVDKVCLLENGRITASGTYDEIRRAKVDFVKLLTDVSSTETREEPEVNTVPKSDDLNSKVAIEVKEQRSVGSIHRKVYLKYFRSGGSFLVIPVCICFILTQVAASAADYFLTFWVNLEQTRTQNNGTLNQDLNLGSNSMLYVYSFIVLFLVVITLTRSLIFVQFCMIASRMLHNSMFSKVVRTAMRFFHTNSSGRVLNRFSRDMGIVDETLPASMQDTIQVMMNVVAITIILSFVNPWIVIPTVIIFILFYGYKTIFLATSRDLKRIESAARSPIYSHLTASLQGLSTIRSLGAQEILRFEFDKHQDLHSSAFYMFLAVSRTFAFWLDINCIIYVALVILSFLFIGTETFAGNVGLAITQSIALTGTLQRGIRQWSELENQMTSVERIVEYTELSPEADVGRKLPPKEWPETGTIRFKNVFMRYSHTTPYVLKSLSFEIFGRSKVGIVGRTGAGKSSLIGAIFRLAQLEGIIDIDDLNTQDIPLDSLRSKISIIPQDPVLFSGSLRKNLDPFDEYSDDQLWGALEEVELKDLVSELPSGLSSFVAESGSNFSVGERQLFCLARVIVRSNKILILDEATANVDPRTDELIQNTIRRRFRDCTVLTIAHRLRTVMDSDVMLVLDEGYVVEFDHPYKLLQNDKGVFHRLVNENGKSMAEQLMKISEGSYYNQMEHGSTSE